MADEKTTSSAGDIDDWLADLEGDDELPAAAASGAGSGDGELEQSDIDALLGGDSGPAAAAAPPPVEEAGELDQSDIDSLFSEGSQAAAVVPEAAAESAPAEDDFAELTQSGLDDLFGDSQAQAAAPPASAKSAAAPAAPAPAAPAAPEKTVAPAAQAEESFGFGDDDFDVDAFDFDDSIPDIPDETMVNTDKSKKAEKSESPPENIFADTEATEIAGLSGKGAGGYDKEGGKAPFVMPAAINKNSLGAFLVVLLLLGGGVYYFLLREPGQEPAIPPQVREQMVQVSEPEPLANTPPVVQDEQHRLDEQTGVAAMMLAGRDEEGDPLTFEVVRPPQHGRLSGDAPQLTYLPNKDFPGEDGFEYRASDGRAVSETAMIKIVGPNLQAQAEEAAAKEKAALLKPARPQARARDLTLHTMSTNPLVIDWAAIWRQANPVPFSAKVAVEIVEQPRQGRLVSLNRSSHRYEPAKYFQGEEIIKYRFRHAGVRSKLRQLTVRVELGDHPPHIHLRPVAALYMVGASVVLDASATRDDEPESLVFSWEQLSGTPVYLESLQDNAARVAFIAPSSFQTEGTPTITFRVTAIDPGGQQDRREVTVAIKSKRHSPLWRGTAAGIAPDPPALRGGLL